MSLYREVKITYHGNESTYEELNSLEVWNQVPEPLELHRCQLVKLPCSINVEGISYPSDFVEWADRYVGVESTSKAVSLAELYSSYLYFMETIAGLTPLSPFVFLICIYKLLLNARGVSFHFSPGNATVCGISLTPNWQ